MTWIAVLISFILVLWLAVKLRPGGEKERVRAAPQNDESAIRIELSTSLRTYDTNKYRFDGLAIPEFKIKYNDDDGNVTVRDIYVHRWERKGDTTYYDCWCFLRDQKRTFRSDRMTDIINLQTNRKIKDIATYRTR